MAEQVSEQVPELSAAPPRVGVAGRSRRTARWIHTWDPGDETFWNNGGRSVARRNLAFSILAEHLGFSVWLLWSIVAVNLNSVGFSFTDSQLFWLVAVPSLVGATLRFPYTFAVPIVGGRNWTVVSALLLLIPALGLAWAVSNPGTSGCCTTSPGRRPAGCRRWPMPSVRLSVRSTRTWRPGSDWKRARRCGCAPGAASWWSAAD